MAEFEQRKVSERQETKIDKEVEKLKVVAKPVKIREEKGVDTSKLETLQMALGVGQKAIRKIESDNNKIALEKLYEAQNNGEDINNEEVLNKISKESGAFINMNKLTLARDKLVGEKVSTEEIENINNIKETFDNDENLQKETDILTYFQTEINRRRKELLEDYSGTNPIIMKNVLDNFDKATSLQLDKVIKPAYEQKIQEEKINDTNRIMSNTFKTSSEKDISNNIKQNVEMLKSNYGGKNKDYVKSVVQHASLSDNTKVIDKILETKIDGVKVGDIPEYKKVLENSKNKILNVKTETNYKKQAEFEYNYLNKEYLKNNSVKSLEELAETEGITLNKSHYTKTLKILDEIDNENIADETIKQYGGSVSQAIENTIDEGQKKYLVEVLDKKIKKSRDEIIKNPTSENISNHINILKRENNGKIDNSLKRTFNQPYLMTEENIQNASDETINQLQQNMSLADTFVKNDIEVFSEEQLEYRDRLNTIIEFNPTNNFKDNLLLFARTKNINPREHISRLPSEVKKKLTEIKDINTRISIEKNIGLMSAIGIQPTDEMVETMLNKKNIIEITVDENLLINEGVKEVEFPSFINKDNYEDYKEVLELPGKFELIPNKYSKTFMIAKRMDNGELDLYNADFISYEEVKNKYNNNKLDEIKEKNIQNNKKYNKEALEKGIRLRMDRNKIIIKRFEGNKDYKDYVKKLKNKNIELRNKLNGVKPLTEEQLKFVEEDIVKNP